MKNMLSVVVCVLCVVVICCGDPLFLSFQVKETPSGVVLPEGIKTLNGVSVSATPDSYRVMNSVYSAFLVEIHNSSARPVSFNASNISLRFSGGSSVVVRSKKKYDETIIPPGHYCDMKISFENPDSALGVRKTSSVHLEIPVKIRNDKDTTKTEMFTFVSFSENDPMRK